MTPTNAELMAELDRMLSEVSRMKRSIRRLRIKRTRAK